MASSTVPGPDFICIGMPKAGTGWLFDQLKYHPDFWMPPVKEFDYLLREVPRLKNVRKRLSLFEKRKTNGSGSTLNWANRSAGDDRDLQFLKEASAYIGKPRDVRAYGALFHHKGRLKSGDISPSYITLPGEVIAQVAEGLPKTKVFMLVRDPVARASSQISMAHRRGKFRASLLDNPDELRAYLEESNTTRKEAFPTQIVARWKAKAPKMDFRCFLFDDIVAAPETVRREILLFIGADPDKKSGELAADHNRKAKAAKVALTDTAKRVLIEHFAAEIRACGELFGNQAREWAVKYGL